MSKLIDDFEINGDLYLKDIGGYDGTNTATSETVKTVLNSKIDVSSKISQITSASTDNELPSASATYTAISNGNVKSAIQLTETVENNATFTYREIPYHNIGDGYSIDSIKGKTLAWNQYAEPLSSNNYKLSNSTVSFSNGVASCTASASYGGFSNLFTFNWIGGHKYYVSVDIKTTITNGGNLQLSSGGAKYAIYLTSSSSNVWTKRIGIITNANNDSGIYFWDTRSSNWDEFQVRNFIIFDLTLMFGSGNEPSTVAEFEALYPLPCYAYNAGELISNKTTAIETVGLNQFDDTTLEIGKYLSGNGQITTEFATRRASENYYPCFPNKAYYIKGASDAGYSGNISWYDANKNWISNSFGNANTAVTSPTNAAFFRVCTTSSTGQICINLSDASRNGTYEPYWKSDIHLGLDAIKVKSPNIWNGNYVSGKTINASNGNEANDTSCGHTDYIPILPNTKYYFRKCGVNSSVIGIGYYDANKNFVSGSVVSETGGANFTRTTPYGAYYMRVSFSLTYLEEVCINVSQTGIDGNYFPYGILTFNGLKSAGSVYDEIKDGKYIKRVGVVDMGTLDWNYRASSGSQANILYASVSGMSTYGANDSGRAAGMMCAKYANGPSTYYGIDANMPEQTLHRYNGSVNVKDSNYSSASSFKTAMSDVMLYYELATPQVFDLAEPIITIGKCDRYGTMRRLPQDTEDLVLAPFVGDITYGLNTGKIVDAINIILQKIGL